MLEQRVSSLGLYQVTRRDSRRHVVILSNVADCIDCSAKDIDFAQTLYITPAARCCKLSGLQCSFRTEVRCEPWQAR